MNTSLGDIIYSTFGDYGDLGVVLCIFLIFLIDSMLFPMLPEVFFILGYNYNPVPEFGVMLVLTAMLAELTGSFSLYCLVKHVKIPARVEKIADSYIKFLMVSSEKVLLLNRITHMVPSVGAFMAIISKWSLKKCAAYIAIGSVLKYTVILMASNFFLGFFSGTMATIVTMGVIVTALCICTAYSIYNKKKLGMIE